MEMLIKCTICSGSVQKSLHGLYHLIITTLLMSVYACLQCTNENIVKSLFLKVIARKW